MSSRSHLLLTVLALALLACGAPTDSSPAPAVVESGPARSSADLLNNQDMMLRHCVKSEVARGNISRPDGDTTLGRISTTRDPSDPFRLGLLTQCIEAGYLDDFTKEDFTSLPTQTPASMPATSMPYTPRATQTPGPTATASPTSTPTPNPLPAELISGVDAMVHCAGETIEYWLEHGPPTLTADLVACLNAYLEQVEG